MPKPLELVHDRKYDYPLDHNPLGRVHKSCQPKPLHPTKRNPSELGLGFDISVFIFSGDLDINHIVRQGEQ
jgi:hypothetical protein